MLGVTLAHWRIVAAAQLQYRLNFAAAMLMLPLNVAMAVGGVWVVFSNTKLVAGWTAAEMLTLVGVALIIQGFLSASVVPAMHLLVQDVRDGNLDHLMLKPHDAQMLALVRVVEPWELGNCIAGVAVAAWGITLADGSVGLLDVATACVLLIPALLIVYATVLAGALIAFWSSGTNIVSLIAFCFDTGRWPLSVYPKWMALMLTFVLPAGIVVTVPSEALTGRLDGEGVFMLLLATGVLVGGCRLLWKLALRSYTSASS